MIVTEEASQKELATTEVSRPVAKQMVLGFLALILLPALLQVIWQAPQGKVFEEFSKFQIPPTRESLRAFEKALDSGSQLRQYFQPRLQGLLSGVGRFGTEKVTIGKNGWLYYAPGLSYLVGHSFLSPEFLRLRTKNMVDKEGDSDPHPNPLPALEQLAQDCKKWGIHLVLVPVPDKAMFVPEPLGAPDSSTLQNADFAGLTRRMEQLGAEVVTLNRSDYSVQAPWFLKQDTHWTPAFMDAVATTVAKRLESHLAATAAAPRFEMKPAPVAAIGDLVELLQLSKDQTLYQTESALAQQVIDRQTSLPLVSDPNADVLLLGDSFSLIYSSNVLHWGESAGFGEHIAARLNRPVEIVAMNGSAATGVRQELVRAAQDGRLQSKKVIVYEFTIRDLSSGSWKPLPLSNPPARKSIEPSAVKQPEVVSEKVTPPEPAVEKKPEVTIAAALAYPAELTGTITFLSKSIDPTIAPYSDGLLYAKMKVEKVESGTYEPKEAIIIFVAMRDRKLLQGAAHKVGERLKVKVAPMRQAPPEYRSWQRSDDTDDFSLVPLFVLEEK